MKIPLGRPRHSWEDNNIKMDLKGGRSWIRFIWHMKRTGTDFCEHDNQLSDSIKCEGFF